MRAGEGVVVLVAHADRRIQPLGQRHAARDRAAEHHAGAVQDHRKARPRQQLRRLGDRRSGAAGGRSKSTSGRSMSITCVQ
jgi:hypothetical protein